MKPTPTPELLPCPFCGGTNLKTGGDDKVVGVWCLTCQAAGPNHYGSREWNDRALSVPAEAVVGEPVDAHREAIDHINRLIVALKPFVEFSQNVEFDADLNTVVWSSRIHRDPLSTWFGPSDFAYARFAVGDTTERLPHIAAPSAPDGWQPIETAPKDGRHVILYCDYYGVGRCAWESWRGVWRSDDPNHGIGFPQPTHWMPLPDFPADSIRAEIARRAVLAATNEDQP